MKVAENEILYIYDSSEIQQRESLVYIKSLPHYKVRELDVRKDKMTQLQLAQLADMLGENLKSMVGEGGTRAEFLAKLDDHDFLDYVVANLFLLRTPIAAYAERAQFVNSQFDLIKEDAVNSLLKEKVALVSSPEKEK